MNQQARDILDEDTVFALLSSAGTVVERALEKRLLPLDLGPTQLRLLSYVYYAKEPLTPSMLAALLFQETHSVSGLLNRLEDGKGLLTRTRDRKDRRVVWVGLTPEGRRVTEEGMRIAAETVTEIMGHLSDRERAALTAGAERLLSHGISRAELKEPMRQRALQRL
jgi:DNA-binding MarR family transcriptional regulator